MFYKIMESLRRFMQGRYGADQLTIALVAVGLVFSLLFSLLHWYWLTAIYWVLMILCIYRILSRNYDKRYAENQKFMVLWGPIQHKLTGMPQQMAQRKVYSLFKCPHCGQKLRLPRGKGLVVVKCHSCGTEFQKKT